MKLTYIEYGRTVSKNYQGKRLALGAEIQEGESVESAYSQLKNTVDSLIDGRKEAADNLRKMAERVERGEVAVEALA